MRLFMQHEEKALRAFLIYALTFLFHLAPTGQAGFVLSKGSLTTNTGGEGEIRKALIENDLVDCVVNLPDANNIILAKPA